MIPIVASISNSVSVTPTSLGSTSSVMGGSPSFDSGFAGLLAQAQGLTTQAPETMSSGATGTTSASGNSAQLGSVAGRIQVAGNAAGKKMTANAPVASNLGPANNVAAAIINTTSHNLTAAVTWNLPETGYGSNLPLQSSDAQILLPPNLSSLDTAHGTPGPTEINSGSSLAAVSSEAVPVRPPMSTEPSTGHQILSNRNSFAASWTAASVPASRSDGVKQAVPLAAPMPTQISTGQQILPHNNSLARPLTAASAPGSSSESAKVEALPLIGSITAAATEIAGTSKAGADASTAALMPGVAANIATTTPSTNPLTVRPRNESVPVLEMNPVCSNATKTADDSTETGAMPLVAASSNTVAVNVVAVDSARPAAVSSNIFSSAVAANPVMPNTAVPGNSALNATLSSTTAAPTAIDQNISSMAVTETNTPPLATAELNNIFSIAANQQAPPAVVGVGPQTAIRTPSVLLNSPPASLRVRGAAVGGAKTVSSASSSSSPSPLGAEENTADSGATPFSVFFPTTENATQSASVLPRMILPGTNAAAHDNHSLATETSNTSPPSGGTQSNSGHGASLQSGTAASSGNQAASVQPQAAVKDADASSATLTAVPNAAAQPLPAASSSSATAVAALPVTAPVSEALPKPAISGDNAPASLPDPALAPAPTPVMAGPVQLAQLTSRAEMAEMRIGMNTSAFGSVEVRTIVHANDVGVVIGSEKGDLRALMQNDMPAITNTLQEQNLRLHTVNFMQGFAFSNDASGGGNAQQRYAAPSRGTATSGPDSGTASESAESLPAMAYSTTSGSLSILA